MIDFSTDLETMGNTPYSAIISVGICAFDTDTGEIDDGLYMNVDLNDCLAKGLRCDASTIMWWMQQSDAARSAFGAGGASLDFALKQITTYIKNFCAPKSAKVWGNGSGFDVNLLEDAYRAANVKCPWGFWQARDMRTVVDLALKGKRPADVYPREGTHHNALDDAKFQAMVIADCIKRLTA